MNNRSENSDYLIGRTIMLLFFLIVIAFSLENSHHQKVPAPDSIEQSVILDNSAVLNKPASIPDYDISLDHCRLLRLTLPHPENKIFLSNHRTTILRKNEELKFLSIKPGLLRSNIIFRITFPEKDSPLIS